MATHQIGKFKFRLSKKGFQYKWGDGGIHTIAFGRTETEADDSVRYQGDDSDYAYENQDGYYPDEDSAEGYDNGYDYADQPEEPAEGDEDAYYGDGEEPQAGPVMEYIENNLWVIIALLVILPPAGIYLLWRLNRFEFTPRVVISAVSGIWFVVALILIFSSIFSGSQDSSTPPAMTLTSFVPTAEPTDEPTDEPTQPESAVTEEQLNAITAAVNTQLGGAKDPTEAVMWIQQQLKIAQTGIYDSVTLNAVAAFQKEAGLENQSGIADEATISALLA